MRADVAIRSDVRVVLVLALACLAAVAGGCGFSVSAAPQCGPTNTQNWIACMLDLAPYREINSATRSTMVDTPTLIRVQHGETCVKAPNAATREAIGFRIKEQASVPMSQADSGTVFMNGWNLRYANGDHHVQALGSAIVNVKEARTKDTFTLNWEAGGVITDDNGEAPFQWCYTYTVVFWSRRSTAFDAVVSSTGLGVTHQTASDPGNGTAVRKLYGQAPNPYGPGVVLPQGFALVLDGGVDHHLLQAGFDHGQHVSTQPGFLNWTARSLLKDNDTRRDYYAGALVATLSYSSPRAWHPATVQRETYKGWQTVDNQVSLKPMSSTSFCNGVGDDLRTEEFKVENVPFQYAVPVLKGWELGYVCTDHHVRELGAAIVDWRYERANNATTGTLYYTLETTLSDDSDNVSYAAASIDILGLNTRDFGTNPRTNTVANFNLAVKR